MLTPYTDATAIASSAFCTENVPGEHTVILPLPFGVFASKRMPSVVRSRYGVISDAVKSASEKIPQLIIFDLQLPKISCHFGSSALQIACFAPYSVNRRALLAA